MLEGKNYSRGMVIVAHADDAEFGCSGTVAKYCRLGWDFVYVLCTDGSKGTADRKLTSSEIKEIRRQEQIDAGKILGLKDVRFLDYPDGMLEPSMDLRKDIAREIRRAKPDVVICPYPMRALDGIRGGIGHPDHMAAGEATLSAVYPAARDHLTFPELLEEGYEPHKVSEVWVMGHPEPDIWIDVTDYMKISTNSLIAHSSQVSGRRTIEEWEQVMRDWRARTAEDKDMECAEAFRRITLG